MQTNPQETADLFTFTKEILHERLLSFAQYLLPYPVYIRYFMKRAGFKDYSSRAGSESRHYMKSAA